MSELDDILSVAARDPAAQQLAPPNRLTNGLPVMPLRAPEALAPADQLAAPAIISAPADRPPWEASEKAWIEIMGQMDMPDFRRSEIAEIDAASYNNIGKRSLNGLDYRHMPLPYEAKYAPPALPLDFFETLKSGFDTSTMGAFRNYIALNGAVHTTTDPRYKIFADEQIAASEFAGQEELFFGSRSGAETKILMRRIRENRKTAEDIARMTGVPEIGQFAGGMLGDPLLYLPATFGLRALNISTRAAQMSADQLSRLGVMHVPYGAISGAMKGGGMQAALAYGTSLIHHGLDPLATPESLAEVIMLPALVGAVAGGIAHGYARWEGIQNSLQRLQSDATYVAGAHPSARRPPPTQDNFVPNAAAGLKEGLPTPEVIKAWQARAAANPQGRFVVSGRVVNRQSGEVLFETAHRDTYRIPSEHIDASSSSGAIMVSAPYLARTPGLMASAWSIEGKFAKHASDRWMGPPISRSIFQDILTPGALATDYGHMRALEIGRELGRAGLPITGRAQPPAPVPPKIGDKRGWLTDEPPAAVHQSKYDGLDVAKKASFHKNEGTYSIDSRNLQLPIGSTFKTSDGKIGTVLEVKHQYAHFSVGDAAAKIAPKAAPPKIGDKRADAPLVHVEDVDTLETGVRGWLDEKGNLSAAVTPGSLVNSPDELLAGMRLAPTGIGIEKLPMDLVSRSANSPFLAHATLIADITGTGGRIRVKNLAGRADLPPVAQVIMARWNRPMVAALRQISDEWIAYRKMLVGQKPDPMPTDLQRIAYDAKTRLRGFLKVDDDLSFEAFRRRVGDATNNGDKEAAGAIDDASDYVERAAKANRKIYDDLAEQAMEVGLFDAAHLRASELAGKALKSTQLQQDTLNKVTPKRAIRIATDDAYVTAERNAGRGISDKEVQNIRAIYADEAARRAQQLGGDEEAIKRALAQTPITAFDLEVRALQRVTDAKVATEKMQKQLDDLRKNGLTTSTAPSFRPRYWQVGKLIAEEKRFKKIVEDHYVRDKNLNPAEAKRAVHEVWLTLARQRPIYERGDIDELFKQATNPMSTQARTFDIPDALVKDFLENDADVLIRAHTKDMAAKIEMKRRFGSTGLEDQIDEIKAEAQRWRDSIAEKAKRTSTRVDHLEMGKVNAHEAQAITDSLAARDMVYGTYGAAADPHRWQSRLIRMAKQYTNITVLGLSGLTAAHDLIRPIMTEGLEAVHAYGFKTLMHESRAAIMRIARNELELAGDGTELINNMRALSTSDTGDVFMHGTRFERGMSQANSYFFVLNGLNAINQLDKEWASVIIQGRMNKVLVALHKGDPITAADRTRLAANGIDDVTGKRIGALLDKHGIDFKSIKLANSEAWGDELATGAYRSALHQQVNVTVPTPGIGDRPNFMSTELGGLLTQYKSFAVAATNRVVIAGLQEGGAKFWYGAALATGYAMILNEIRSRLFYDRSTFDKPATAVIADGIERASLLGWFSDANRAIEVLSNHTLGARPVLGLERPREESFARKVGTIAGPAAGQVANMVGVAEDFMRGHPTARTWANARQALPGQNLSYMDPVMDRLISDGKWHTERRKKSPSTGLSYGEAHARRASKDLNAARKDFTAKADQR